MIRLIPVPFLLYLFWSACTLLLTFYMKGWDVDNITHILLLCLLSVTLMWALKTRSAQRPKNPRLLSVGAGVLFAALAEGCYMISQPFLLSLTIRSGMPIMQMIRNYSIDLMFTLPVYVFIFSVIWRLINRYRYGRWEYIFVFALAQALGDGNQTFLHAPTLLLFIPYVMINYHAINLAPYLVIERHLPQNRSDSHWKLPLAVLSIVLTYLVGGAIIVGLSRVLGFSN